MKRERGLYLNAIQIEPPCVKILVQQQNANRHNPLRVKPHAAPLPLLRTSCTPNYLIDRTLHLHKYTPSTSSSCKC